MSEFKVTQLTEKKIDSIAHMLAPEIVSAVKRGLPVTALAVVEDDTAVGALGGAIDGDTFEIVSIYVSPDRRRKGAGTALMKTLFELADAEDLMVRAEYTPMDSEGRTIEPFLTAMDFMKEKIIFPVYSSEILENFNIDSKSLPGSMTEIFSFAEAPQKLLEDAMNMRRDEDEILGDLDAFIGLLDKNISFLATEKGKITSCILAERDREGVIEVTPIWSPEPDVRSMKLMLSFALDEMKSVCPRDTCVIIPSLDPETLKIVEEICGTSATVTLGFVKKSFVSLDN